MCHPKQAGHRVARNLSLTGIGGNIVQKDWPVASPFLGNLHEGNLSDFYQGRPISDSKVIGIHPGSSRQQGATKRPSTQVIRNLEARLATIHPDWLILRLFGPDETDLMALYPESALQRNLPLSNISHALSALSCCNALIAGDSGYGHLAATLNLPVISLAGPTDITCTCPWTSRGIIVKTREQLDCMPCYGTPSFTQCPINNQCMNGISPEDILSALLSVLN